MSDIAVKKGERKSKAMRITINNSYCFSCFYVVYFSWLEKTNHTDKSCTNLLMSHG